MAIEVLAAQDRAFVPFADGQVDGWCRPRDERDDGGLVALAEDAQRAMAAFDAEVLDVGGARGELRFVNDEPPISPRTAAR